MSTFAYLPWLIPALACLFLILRPGLMDDGPGEPVPDRLHEYITLRQAAAELPRRRAGRKTHVKTLFRWAGPGCRGIVLRTVLVGAVRCTTRAWLAEFFAALTAARRGATPAPPAAGVRTLAARRRAIAAAQAAANRFEL
jgi:hypothetical protein